MRCPGMGLRRLPLDQPGVYQGAKRVHSHLQRQGALPMAPPGLRRQRTTDRHRPSGVAEGGGTATCRVAGGALAVYPEVQE